MTRTFALTLKRPHETLGLPMPLGRKLRAVGKNTWGIALLALSFATLGMYAYQVSRAASQGFTLRREEKRLESLKDTVSSLENQTAQLQTIRALELRVKALGYVSVDRMDFIDPAHGVAMVDR